MKIEKWVNVLTILNGRNQKKVENINGKYPIYGSGGIMGYANDYICPENTVIIGRKGSINNPIFVSEKFWNVDTAFGLLANEKILNPKYLYYFCKEFNFNKLNTTVTIPSLTKERLKKIKIPLPKNLDDQIRIANLLSQVESLIAKREESIKLLDELLKSTFLDMFGDYDDSDWKLADLCSEIVDCPHSTPKYSNIKTDFSCLRTSEFSNGYIDNSSMKYVNENEYLKRVKRLIPEFGDIVYAREGSYGDAIRVPKNELICLGQRTLLFRPKQEICNSIFLWALIRSEDVFRQAKKKNKGATVGRVNVKDIKAFKVFLPPKHLQDKFANIVQQVEQTKQHHQKSLKELKNLFGSLSQRAFRGDLDLNMMKK